MSFTCPDCHQPKSLKISQVIDLPPDSRSDEITVQIVSCEACNFRAAAVYEESRRGAAETMQHTGYRLTVRVLVSLADTITKCPQPRHHGCQCPSHRALAWTDDNGRWEGLGVPVEGTFPMVLG